MPRDSNDAMTCCAVGRRPTPMPRCRCPDGRLRAALLRAPSAPRRLCRRAGRAPSRRSDARLSGSTPPRGACDSATLVPAGIAVRTKTRSPQMTGEAEPRPGISTFQRTFFVRSTRGADLPDGRCHWQRTHATAARSARRAAPVPAPTTPGRAEPPRETERYRKQCAYQQ